MFACPRDNGANAVATESFGRASSDQQPARQSRIHETRALYRRNIRQMQAPYFRLRGVIMMWRPHIAEYLPVGGDQSFHSEKKIQCKFLLG